VEDRAGSNLSAVISCHPAAISDQSSRQQQYIDLGLWGAERDHAMQGDRCTCLATHWPNALASPGRSSD